MNKALQPLSEQPTFNTKRIKNRIKHINRGSIGNLMHAIKEAIRTDKLKPETIDFEEVISETKRLNP